MEAAQVAVGQQRRDHAEQEHGAQRRPGEARAAAVGPDDPDAEQPLADGEPADRGEQVNLDGEQDERPVQRGEVVRVAAAKRLCLVMPETISSQSTQSTISAASRLPMGATDIGPSFGKPKRLPG